MSGMSPSSHGIWLPIMMASLSLGSMLLLGSVPASATSPAATEPWFREHYGARHDAYILEPTEPVSLFTCKLMGGCKHDGDEAIVPGRLIQVASSLSLMDLAASLCGRNVTHNMITLPGAPYLPDTAPLCVEPEATLRSLDMLRMMAMDVTSGLPGVIGRVVASPDLPLHEDLPPQCLKNHIPVDVCIKTIEWLAQERLCYLQSMAVKVSPQGLLASSLTHLCEPPPSRATRPVAYSLVVTKPTDTTRLMGTQVPVTVEIEALPPAVAKAECDFCVLVEGQLMWCEDLATLSSTGDGRRGPITRGAYVNGQSPSWRCVQEVAPENSTVRICVDRFSMPGLRRLEVQTRCLPRLKGAANSNASVVVLSRNYANIYVTPEPSKADEPPKLSIRFRRDVITNSQNGTSTQSSMVVIGEYATQLQKAGRLQTAESVCGAGTPECQAFVLDVLEEQMRELFYTEAWGLNSHLIEQGVVYHTMELSVLFVPSKVNQLITQATSLDANQTVCEVGFNAGHSALCWLLYAPGMRLLSFDLLEHSYTSLAVNYLLRRFPGRLQLVAGDSTLTVPTFAKFHPGTHCDLIFIDGGHDYATALSDLEHLGSLAHERSVVIVDDIDLWEVQSAWNDTISRGLVETAGNKTLSGRTCEGFLEVTGRADNGFWYHIGSNWMTAVATGRYTGSKGAI